MTLAAQRSGRSIVDLILGLLETAGIVFPALGNFMPMVIALIRGIRGVIPGDEKESELFSRIVDFLGRIRAAHQQHAGNPDLLDSVVSALIAELGADLKRLGLLETV